jgi:hypothetical protein
MTEDRSLRRVREVQDRYREVLDHLKEKDQARDVQIQESCRNFKKKVRPMINRVSSKQIEILCLA